MLVQMNPACPCVLSRGNPRVLYCCPCLEADLSIRPTAAPKEATGICWLSGGDDHPVMTPGVNMDAAPGVDAGSG